MDIIKYINFIQHKNINKKATKYINNTYQKMDGDKLSKISSKMIIFH